jgi:hypothetical protein
MLRLHRAILFDLDEGENGRLAPWEGLFVILRHFLSIWEQHDPLAYARTHRILERDGYQCAVPGCRARRGLEVHHIVFRSRGGTDARNNLVTLCATHHRLALHEKGSLACKGSALRGLEWTLGALRYHGDVCEGYAM